MKKIFTKMMLWAVAATAIVSCENNFNDTTVNGDTNLVKVTLTADKPTVVSENRTELREGVPYWSADDQIGVYTQVVEGESTTYNHNPFKNDSEEASLTTTFTGTTAVSNTLFVYYPYAGGDAINDKGVVKANLLSTQAPTVTSFDGAADIMFAKPVTLDEEGNQLSNLEFARLGAIVKVVLKDNTSSSSLSGQHPSTLTMTASEGDLAGKVYLDVINQELGTLYDDGSRSKRVTANYTAATHFEINNENAVYLIVYPQTLAQGTTLSFTAVTEGYNIAKEITLPEDIVLESGKVTTLNVSLAEEHLEAVEVVKWVDNAYNLIPSTAHLAVGDKVVIVAKDYDKAMSAFDGGNNCPAVDVTKKANNTVEISSDVEILTVEAGNIDGTFAFKTTSSSKYLYAASSSGNHLKEEATLSNNSSFMVVITEGVASVVAQGNYTRNTMRYNNASTLFSCYSDGQQDICIYKLVGNVLTVSQSEISGVSHEGETKTFTYSVANPVDGVSATVTDNADWITTADNNGTVTVTVEANEVEEAREGVVTVTYGDLTKTVTVKQNAKPTEGGVVANSVTYTVSSTSACTTSGTAPTGSSAAFKNTYTSNKEQVTNGNSATFTLSGYTGATIKAITLKMHSNTSKGEGKFSAVAGSTTLASISSNTKFDKWYDNNRMETDYRDVHVTLTNDAYVIKSGENVVIKIEASVNSLFIQSVTLDYEISGGNTGGGEGGETPDPDPDPEQPGTGVVVLSEEFDNTTTADNNNAITTSTFPNFSGATDKAYKGKYGSLKLGTSKAAGYITTKSLDLSSTFTVQIDACKYSSDTGNIVVTCGSQTQTIYNSELGAAGSFKTFTLTFSAATATSTVKIATSSKRAYIDNVVITRN